MRLRRRTLLKALGAAGLLLNLPALAAPPRARPIIWRNWSGGQTCIPSGRFAPASEEALAALVRTTSGTVRPVGSAHSFSALVPTDGNIVSLANLSGMIGHDAQRLQSEFWAGTPMSQMGPALQKVGLALTNMADIDQQTLAGAISTSTHGTGPKFGSYSTQVIGLRLLKADGEYIDCDAQNQPEIFNAARVSLGALGLITRVRLQNRRAFRLRSKHWVQDTEELLEDMPRLIREYDHFEINSLLHCDVSVATALNETKETQTIAKAPGGDIEKVKLLYRIHDDYRKVPNLRAKLLNFIARNLISFPDAVDDSYKIFANVRDVRFNEMEYEVPAEAGPACLREILKKIRDQQLESIIPIEFRYIKADDIPLSMFQGRDSCAISVHQHYTMDYHNFFAQIEPIFWKYDGRPHWGKLHSLNARLLEPLYPKWKDFLAVREALDPTGKFLNAHLRQIFGVGA